MILHFHIIAFFVLGAFAFQGAHVSPPLPERKVIDDKTWSDKPAQLEQEAKNLSKQKSGIENKLKDLKKNLQDQAEDIQSHEEDLKRINQLVKHSEKSLHEQKEALKEQREQIAGLITSLVKMNSIPLDTLMLLPAEKSEDLMVSYHTLRTLHPELERQVSVLEEQIKSLETKKKKLKEETEAKEAKTALLKDKRQKITGLIKKRQAEYRNTTQAYKDIKTKALYASKTAKNLDELVRAVKKKNEALEKKAEKEVKASRAPRYVSTNTKKLPIKGTMLVGYGETDHIGAKSKGVRIKGVSGGLVIAPKSGVVKYAGEFRKYGRIILIEHAKNYHSLIAGLDKIDTVVGQNVSEGEPIAHIGDRATDKHTVYYELRL
ncbi:MAG: murein hydrolase activator EnvC family protein, partial [Bdellovibrionales bacterium]